MEHSDEPYEQSTEETQAHDEAFAFWRTLNPCPERETYCKRCYIDYTSDLATQALGQVRRAAKK